MRTLSHCLLIVLSASVVWAGDSWLQWRGPGRDGVISGAEWPATLSDGTLTLQWAADLEPGYSGPLITTNRVFVCETRKAKDEVVRAFDLSTGNEIWSTSWPGSMTVPFFAAANGSWIRSTPTLDDDDLFVAGMRDVLVCLDANTGKQKWRVDFVKEFKSALPSFGCVCSPLVDGEYVFIQAAGGLVKLKRETGEVVWRTLEDGGGMFGSAFSSPVIASIKGLRQAIVQTRSSLTGVALESGKVLWSTKVEAFRGMNILTPSVIGDQVFTSSYGGGSHLFEITRTETDGFAVKQLWRNKVQGYMSSPVVIDGHLYLHLRNQRFACINLQSGEEQWISQPYGKYWSIVASGTQILALDERGELLLIEASPEGLNIIDRRKISDSPTWAHVAVAGSNIAVRDLNRIHVFRWRNEATESSPQVLQSSASR